MRASISKSALAGCLAGAIVASAPAPATAGSAKPAGWVRTYVVEWYEPAMYYGAKDGTTVPGTDCPAGANPAPDWIKVLTDAGYTRKEAEWMRDPANPTRSAVNGQPMMGFRGENRQNVYDFPTTAKEVGLPPVTGRIAYGLDLDGDASTGFESPTGAKGVDNAFYKALGCWKTYRGPPRKSSGAQGENDSMREGAWTVVVVVSGTGKDPLNDRNVRVGIYDSNDKLVRDGMGEVASDYTFKLQPDRVHEAVFEGSTRKGRIIAKGVGSVVLRNPGYDRNLPLLKSKLEMRMQPDGKLTGLLGGYRPWLPVYKGWVAGRGPVIEVLTWVQLPDVYYALKRYADYSPSGPGGEKTHISYAMQIDAVPAFVMEPGGTTAVAQVRNYRVRNMDKPPLAEQSAGNQPAGKVAELQSKTAGGRFE